MNEFSHASENIPLKYCPRCNRDLPATTEYFSQQSNAKDGLRYFCKDCRHKDYLADLARNPDMLKQSAQKQRKAFLAKSPEDQEQIRACDAQRHRIINARKRQLPVCKKCFARPRQNGNLCKQCYEYRKQWRQKNADSVKAVQKRTHNKVRIQVFTAYGGRCICCNETRIEFLSVDHVNNNGGKHRRETGLRGLRLYYWLRKQDFPQEGYQLLCHNCNWLKHIQHDCSEKKTCIQMWNAQLRQETIDAYGGKCACCGEARTEVLTIDHINGDGNKHRNLVGGGSVFYAWLRRNNFPQEEYQLLCRNCNHAKFACRICPHQNNTP